MRRSAYVIGVASAMLAACAAELAPPVTPDLVSRAARTPVPLDRPGLERGREAFLARCAECHALPDPRSEEPGAWPPILKRMGRLARLDEATEREVLAYVLAVRGD